MPTPDNDSNDPSAVRDYSKYAGMAFKMGAIITLSVLLGKYLDGLAGFTKPPIFLIICSLLGVGLAIYSIIKDLIK